MATLKVKVLLSFLRLAIVDKILKGKLIISGVTTQAAKLPNLPFTVAQLTAVNDDLDKKTQELSDLKTNYKVQVEKEIKSFKNVSILNTYLK
jgi:monomeric isocitrate dehydrogenase